MPTLKTIPACATIPFALNPLSTDKEDWASKNSQMGNVVLQPVTPEDGVAKNYYGSIDRIGNHLEQSDMSSIGTATDTNYTAETGDHSGTTLVVATLTDNIYQNTTTPHNNAVLNWDGEFASDVVSLDDNGDIHVMNEDDLLAYGTRLLQKSLETESVGSFRIASNYNEGEADGSPNHPEAFESDIAGTGGTWENWSSGFMNSQSDPKYKYSIWRKTANDPETPAGKLYNPDDVPELLKRSRPLILKDTFDLEEMDDYAFSFFNASCTNLARLSTTLGDMLLLPSTQTPAGNGETGTWQTRGSMKDRIRQTTDIQYTSITYNGPQNPVTYNTPYEGYYAGVRFVDVPGTFQGYERDSFEGTRDWAGSYAGSRNFSGSYTGQRNFSHQYVGTGYYNGQRRYQGSRSANFPGPKRSYIGQVATGFIQYITTTTQRPDAGTFSDSSFIRTYVSSQQYRQYQRNVQGSFAGIKYYTGSRPYLGRRYYQGRRYYVGPGYFRGSFRGIGKQIMNPQRGDNNPAIRGDVRIFDGGPWRTGFFIGYLSNYHKFLSNIEPFLGQWKNFNSPPQSEKFIDPNHPYTGARLTNFPGPNYRSVWAFYNGFRQTNVNTVSYETVYRQVNTPYTDGITSFAGTRFFNYAQGAFSSPANSENFTNTEQYGGSRQRNRSFDGFRTYQGNYSGFRTKPGSYNGTRAADFNGFRSERYEAPASPYTGTYQSQRVVQYNTTSNIQYTGETIVAAMRTLETYTLYVKVSET